MTFVMADAAFGRRVMRRVNDPQEFGVADLALQRREIILQLLAERFERRQEIRPVFLQLVADGFALGFRGRLFKLGLQESLLREKLVAGFIEINDQVLDIVWRAPQIAIEILVIVRNHDNGRGCARLCEGRAGSAQTGDGHSGQDEVTNCFHFFFCLFGFRFLLNPSEFDLAMVMPRLLTWAETLENIVDFTQF